MAYNKIIVPLDGSKLAETVLPHVEMIAKGCSVPEVVLVTVTEKVRGRMGHVEPAEQMTAREFQPLDSPTIIFTDRFYSGRVFQVDPGIRVSVEVGKMARTGHAYLVKIADRLKKQGIQTSIAVLVGKVAEEICYFAHEENADLIIMASRGKTGRFRKWDVANSAADVFKDVNVPILLIKPPAGFKETKAVRKGKA